MQEPRRSAEQEAELAWKVRVPPHLAGKRLSEALCELTEGYTRSQLERLIRRGRLCKNGCKVLRSNLRVQAGDELHLRPPGPSVSPEPLLPLLFEDSELLVFDKPAGLLTHATRRRAGSHHLSTIANRLYGPLPTLAGPERPGIVHRLDRQTSGVIVLARTAPSFEGLKRQFKERRTRKQYWALVQLPDGQPAHEAFDCERPLAARDDHPDRQRLCAPGEGKSARTHFRLREAFDGFALYECRPESGRRHQIRLHLAAHGLQLIGERLYRNRSATPWPREAPRMRRHALHAGRLQLEHPTDGRALDFAAPLPADMLSCIDWLREHRR